MSRSRREFLVTAAAAGTVTLLPWRARAEADVFKTPGGDVTVHPVSHASFVMETPVGPIYVDPVGEASAYEGFGAPALVLVTHRHGDHYNADTLAAIRGDAPIVTNRDVFDMMPEALQGATTVLGHDAPAEIAGAGLRAIPAYNLDPATKFHPRERGDNGYVISLEGFTVYVSGDTEDIPEMRALEGIDLAFVCMNLPFTMTSGAAASAVAAFRPSFVYPYHYRGRDGGTQDPKAFAEAVGDAAEVRLVDWYPDNPDV